MEPPKGYTGALPGQVCRLIKSLYGLKQASREWDAEFYRALSFFRFSQSIHDHCLFTKGVGATFVVLLVYILDILDNAGLLGAHVASTPFPSGVTFTGEGLIPLVDVDKYRRVVGKFLYSILQGQIFLMLLSNLVSL